MWEIQQLWCEILAACLIVEAREFIDICCVLLHSKNLIEPSIKLTDCVMKYYLFAGYLVAEAIEELGIMLYPTEL